MRNIKIGSNYYPIVHSVTFILLMIETILIIIVLLIIYSFLTLANHLVSCRPVAP
ncbi:Putative membrane protein (modular protein) [uncultured Citrobacter sp.]|uniref:Putative membrane protein (Modular protein) n=1 Tax=uncultured Citrobacter sp. TaxID=200446 RepID=A0A212INU0_9ENTR|nr:Putative membrane protein (modular protein) [uncultured Citrobacter sp.]SBV68458.1 Putative membrane protein (modular protein) [uncultured Citrobacter sp.]